MINQPLAKNTRGWFYFRKQKPDPAALFVKNRVNYLGPICPFYLIAPAELEFPHKFDIIRIKREQFRH
jgi:hypothetical protein